MSDHLKIRGNSRDAGASPIALAMVFGALVGAGVAVLLAPRAGSQTRRDLTDYGRRWSREARSKFRQARDSARGLGRDVKAAVEDEREAAES